MPQIAHDDIATGLWGLIWAGTVAGGALAGHWWWPSRKRLEAEYVTGYRRGYIHAEEDLLEDAARAGQEAEPDSNGPITGPGRPGAFTLADPTPEQWVRSYPETAPAAVRPAGPSPAAGRTIYPELAALDGPQAGSAGTETAGVLGWRAGPHWYPDGLHWLADWQADWHAASASFDDWLPGYLDWFRRSLEPSWSRGGELVARAMEQMS